MRNLAHKKVTLMTAVTYIFRLAEGGLLSFSRAERLCDVQRRSSGHSGILDQTLWPS